MAGDNWGLDFTYTAGQDFSGASGQYRLVKAGSVEGEVLMSVGAAGSVIGVIQNNPATGAEAVVRVFGVTKVYANAEDGGSALALLGHIKSGSDGMAVGSLNFAASGWNSCGLAMQALSTGSGILIDAFIYPAQRLAG